MATIYYSKDSIINKDDTVDVWVNSFIPEDEAKQTVIDLNNLRNEDDLDNNIEYYYLINDWTEPSFYDE